ncbi:MAG: Hpt domain-containing protein [Cyanobacteria bacterium P01_H01_bin.105]
MATNFDQEQLEQLSGGDKVFEQELLQMFVGDTENSLSQLATAVSVENPTAIEALAHYIKGASANVGAVGMSRTAARLEMIAKKGDLSGAANSLRQLQILHQEVRRLAS